MSNFSEKRAVCTFCLKTEEQVQHMIVKPDTGAAICENCLRTCNKTMLKQIKSEVVSENRLPFPAEIKARLDEYVIGQEHAKRILSVSV